MAVMEQQQNGNISTPASSSSSASTCCWPLASKYRAPTGIYQSLSLILNAGLMIYAHVGLSAVFVSNQQNIGAAVSAANESVDTANPTMTSNTNVDGTSCSVDDRMRWTSVIGPDGMTGADNKTYESSFCSTKYVDPDTSAQCLVDANCIAKCFTTFFNYTDPCADCFAAIPLCSLTDGCFVCSGSPQSEECYGCTLRCNQIFQNCSGLSIDLIRRPWETTTSANDTNTTTTTTGPVTVLTSKNNNTNNEQVCAAQKEGVEYQKTKTYHTVFEVLFFQSMDIAWKNDARLLAVIVVAFSLVWPYTKNVILMFAWYWPMTEHSRTQILLWLRRLGKYTLIDVFVILILIVGVVLELDLNGVPVVARGEPRPAILAFLGATLWEFVHIEWMVLFHHRTIESSKSTTSTAAAAANTNSLSTGNDDNGNLAQAIRFRDFGKTTNSTATSIKQFRNPVLLRCFLSCLLLISLALFAVGASLDLVRFQTALKDDEVGCVRSYNLFTFPTIAVSDLVLHQNDAVIGIWTLVVSFMVFVLVVPWCVHVVHALAFWFGVKSRALFRAAEACWTFSCVEVFLIALYVIEYKFKQLIARLAGEEGAALFEVTSELGPGFFVLIAYTICGGFVHYFFSNAVSEYYALDPHHKVDYIWTILFNPALIVTDVVAVGDDLSAPPDTEQSADLPKQSAYKDIAVEEVI